MARKNLSSMLSVVEGDGEDAPAAADPAAEPAPAPPQAQPESNPTPEPAAKQQPPAKQASERDAAKARGELVDDAGASLPRYLELTRKEARFTDDQLDELAALTRKLNKTRRGRGERITDNTLIRVAVDLLLQRTDDLEGHDEASLRHSVGL